MSKNSELNFNMNNPVVRRIARTQEQSEEHVTYSGISAKVFFYLVMIVAGLALCIVMEHSGASLGFKDMQSGKGFTFKMSLLTDRSVLFGCVAMVLFIIAPLLSVFIRPIVPVTGTLYCISTGYLVTFLATLIEEYKSPVMIALVLTIALFSALAGLYASGVVKVSQKFRTMVFAIVIASIIGSILLFICGFIPALRFIPAAIYGNTILGMVFSVLGLILACLFVIVDFDTIEKAVTHQLPKKYEWYCAYGLVFSFIYLYFKILDILLRIMKK